MFDMDFDYFNDLLANVSTEDQEQQKEFIQAIAEIRASKRFLGIFLNDS